MRDNNMTSNTRPSAQYVDHRGPMAFIDELVSVTGESARCCGVVRADNPFLVEDRLPSWILVEYMAQSVALFAGFTRATQGKEHQHGLLLGCRNLRLEDVAFEIGSRLVVEVVETARFEQLGSFSGTVTFEEMEVGTGTLSVYETTEWPASRTDLLPGTGTQT